jgi:hypothetical protein
MTTEIPLERIKLDYYALGKYQNPPSFQPFTNYKATSDHASDLLKRNCLSLNSSNLEIVRNNYKTLNTLDKLKTESNNYLHPIEAYNNKMKYGIDKTMTNKETYNITKNKYFASDFNSKQDSSIKEGVGLSNADFKIKKLHNSEYIPSLTSENHIGSQLKDNLLVFDKTRKDMIRYPKGHWAHSSEKKTRTKISKEAPEWFKVVTDEKAEYYDNLIAKTEDTLNVFSRYQKWITVTPRSKNRKYPLEKQKKSNMEETSKTMPKWMQIKHGSRNIQMDPMKTAEYQSYKTGKKYMVLVDKNENLNHPQTTRNLNNIKENKSVFSLGDFRHNLPYIQDANQYMEKVSQKPKEFFHWNDGTTFNPKFKRDKY